MSGPRLRLSSGPPLLPDRGIVAVQAGRDYDAKVIERRILDLETGAVVTSVSNTYYAYPGVGVALGWAEVDGASWIVAVHGSDGLVVPLWREAEAETHDLVIHPHSGEAWVFEATPDSAKGTLRYAAWTNLREPPPRAAREFPGTLADPSATVRPPGRLGPDIRNPASVPIFVDLAARDETCEKAELRADGHACVPRGLFALAEGWRLAGPSDGETITAVDPIRQEVQHLELGEDCRVSSVSLDPARAIIQCGGEETSVFLWAPERTFAVPTEVFRGPTQWGRNGHVAEVDVPEGAAGQPGATYWVDVVRERALKYRAVSLLTPYAIDRYAIVEDPPESNHLFAVEIETATTYPLPIDGQGCTRLDTPATEFPWVAVGCYDAHDRVRRIDVVDLAGHRIWRLPALREMWLQPEGSRVVGLLVAGAETRVVSWTLAQTQAR